MLGDGGAAVLAWGGVLIVATGAFLLKRATSGERALTDGEGGINVSTA